MFLTSCASTTDKQSILNTEADINYVESDADRAAREAQEEMDAQAAEQAELEAQAERERLRQEEEMERLDQCRRRSLWFKRSISTN